MKNVKQIIENLEKAKSLKAIETATKAANLFYQTSTSDDEKNMVREKLLSQIDYSNQKIKQLNKEFDNITAQFEVKNVAIEVDGIKYPLAEWVTINTYCKQFGLKSTSIVTNWIKRGIVPKNNILFLKELNSLKLIKAIRYMD